jgi:AcrR family transcriptional regulator
MPRHLLLQLEVALELAVVARRAPAPKFGGVRTGGRSARVVDEVLRATVELLAEHGYAALRFDEVAARSGVNKTTLYRRWPTKSQLVGAALREYKRDSPAPDSGDLERDLVDMFVRSMSRFDAHVTRGLMRMFHAERNDPELDAILAEIRATIAGIRRVRIDIAVARRELPARTRVELLLSTVSAAVYSQLLANGKPPSRAAVTEIVQLIVAGARVRWGATTPHS